MHLYGISFVSISYFMYFTMKQPPVVPLGLKIRHYLVTVTIAMVTASDAYTLAWIIMHPQWAWEHFYKQSGFVPPWVIFSLNIGSVVLGTVLWIAAYSLTFRYPKARQLFLRLWLYYVAMAIILCAFMSQEIAGSVSSYIFLCAFVIAIFGGLGWLIYLHLRSPSSDVLFEENKQPNKSLEPTATAH